MPGQFTDEQLVRYLLGGLRGKEKAFLERQYLVDDGQFEYLCALEDELIDRYLRNQLSARQRNKFEKHFLASARRRERVQAAKAFMDVFAPVQTKRVRARIRQIPWKTLAWSFGCLLLVSLTSASWLIWRNITLQNQLAAGKLTLEHAAIRPSPLTVSFVLAPVQRGTGDSNRLIIPSEAQFLKLSVEVPKPAEPPYRAIFRTPDGDQAGVSTDVSTSLTGNFAEIRAPTAIFSSGTYILTLQGSRPSSGFEDLRSYSFAVARK